MDFILKHKKIYLLAAGTLLPAFVLKKAADFLSLSEETQNVLFLAGAVTGYIITRKMTK